MSGSSFGRLFRITTWGESHGPGIGVVIDGCPAGLAVKAEDIQAFLDRRKPGQNKFTTRKFPETSENKKFIAIFNRIYDPCCNRRFVR